MQQSTCNIVLCSIRKILFFYCISLSLFFFNPHRMEGGGGGEGGNSLDKKINPSLYLSGMYILSRFLVTLVSSLQS